MAYVWREVLSLESTYADEVKESWDILLVGDEKEETVEAEKSPLQPWHEFCVVFLTQTQVHIHCC